MQGSASRPDRSEEGAQKKDGLGPRDEEEPGQRRRGVTEGLYAGREQRGPEGQDDAEGAEDAEPGDKREGQAAGAREEHADGAQERGKDSHQDKVPQARASGVHLRGVGSVKQHA